MLDEQTAHLTAEQQQAIPSGNVAELCSIDTSGLPIHARA
jgi:hypothetical protein